MRRQWFDKRADDGNYWTVTKKTDWAITVDRWFAQEKVMYLPVSVVDAHNADIRDYGKMTKEEAIAMAKLLNATTEGVQHDSK